ncbi:hypothetical protein [Psychrobacter glacincola]|uniref:hypothetical protein n=1 Tax=Psychrobacter glacincola TaxID=56810 RepID=UPI0039B10552
MVNNFNHVTHAICCDISIGSVDNVGRSLNTIAFYITRIIDKTDLSATSISALSDSGIELIEGVLIINTIGQLAFLYGFNRSSKFDGVVTYARF